MERHRRLSARLLRDPHHAQGRFGSQRKRGAEAELRRLVQTRVTRRHDRCRDTKARRVGRGAEYLTRRTGGEYRSAVMSGNTAPAPRHPFKSSVPTMPRSTAYAASFVYLAF